MTGPMQMWTPSTEARLLYAEPPRILDDLANEQIGHRLARLGMQPLRYERAPGQLLALVLPGLRLRIAEIGRPLPLSRLRGVTRPAEPEARRRDIHRRLAEHRACVTVSVEHRGPARAASVGLKRRLVWAAVETLLSQHPPELVLCPGRDRVMTVREASVWLDHVDSCVPHFRPGEDPRRTKRKEMFLTDPNLSPRARQWIDGPPAAAADDAGHTAAQAVRAFLDHRPDARTLSDTAAGRSALYVMSATMMLFALPLGASALTYNALSGGSLRLTAHAMAATGLMSMADSVGISATWFSALL